MPSAKPISKEMILRAMKYTKSNRAAARYLGCSYQHYFPYAKMFRVDDNDPESPTLFDVHKNPSGKGIPKFLPNKRKEPNVRNIVETGQGWESFTTDKIKNYLIKEAILKDECCKCGFKEKRVTDYKTPLLLNFKDGYKNNYLFNNLELLCYNCYFLYVADPLSSKQVRYIEDHSGDTAKPFEWDLSEEQIDNMKSLGLFENEEEDEPGAEFISYRK